MDRLRSALALVAVLALMGAEGRDKAIMPGAKEEEGQSGNATAMRTVVPEPSAGGRVDPGILGGMYNGSLDVPIDNEPRFSLDGETLAVLPKKVALRANATEQAFANGTVAKAKNGTIQAYIDGENSTGSSAGNATMTFDASTGAQAGGLPHTTTATMVLDESSGAQKGALPKVANATMDFDESVDAQKGALPKAANATMVFDESVDAQKGALPKATAVTTRAGDESIASIGLGDATGAKTGPVHGASGDEPIRQFANQTVAGIEPYQNAMANGTLAWAGNMTAHAQAVNGTLAWAGNTTARPHESIGALPWGPNATAGTANADPSANGPVVRLTKSSKGQMGPLANETGSSAAAAMEKPNYLPTTTTSAPAEPQWALRKPNPETEPLRDDAYGGDTLLWARYRLASGEEPQASSNRSNDPDVVAIKEIASAVLEGSETTVSLMTTKVIQSVLPDGENGTMTRDNELHEAIREKFEDKELMMMILEGDADEAPVIPEQGPCEACPQPASVVCSLCWPADFCRPFASKVDIPCPAKAF